MLGCFAVFSMVQTLQFKDVCVDLTNKRIIWSVSGNASPGRVLAIMGPSGTYVNT